jgi:DNA primase
VLAAINHPALVERREADFLGLSFQNQALNDLLGEVLSAILTDPALDSAGLKRHLQSTKAADILERVLSDDTLNRQTFLRPAAEIDEVEWGWNDALRLHLFAVEAERDLAQTASQLFSLGDEAWKAAAASGSQLAHATDEESRQAGDAQEEAKRLKDALERASATVRSKSRR